MNIRNHPPRQEVFHEFREQIDSVIFSILSDVTEFITGYGSPSGPEPLNKAHSLTTWNPNVKGLIEGLGFLYGHRCTIEDTSFEHAVDEESNVNRFLPGYRRIRGGWREEGACASILPLNLGAYYYMNRGVNEINRSYFDQDFGPTDCLGIFYKIWSHSVRYPITYERSVVDGKVVVEEKFDLKKFRHHHLHSGFDEVSKLQVDFRAELENIEAKDVKIDYQYKSGPSATLSRIQSVAADGECPNFDRFVQNVLSDEPNLQVVPNLKEFHDFARMLVIMIQTTRGSSSVIQHRVKRRYLNSAGQLDPLCKPIASTKYHDPELYFAAVQQQLGIHFRDKLRTTGIGPCSRTF